MRHAEVHPSRALNIVMQAMQSHLPSNNKLVKIEFIDEDRT